MKSNKKKMTLILIICQLKNLLREKKITQSEYLFLQDDLLRVEDALKSKDRLIERLTNAIIDS